MYKFWHWVLAVSEIFVKWVLSIVAAFACVMNPAGVPIAIGFMAVSVSSIVDNPYLKVIVSAGGAIAAMWLILNFAEVAIVLTAFRFKMLIDRYVFHLERQIDGEPIVVPMIVGAYE